VNCGEAKPKLAAVVLGDLEGPELDLVSAHLRDCAACRAEKAHLEGSLGAMKRLPAPEPRPTRRVRTVAAMVAATESAIEAPPRRSWARYGVAASLILAVTATWAGASGKLAWMMNTPEFALTVEDLKGEALIMRSQGSQWEPLAPRATVRLGDRVLTNGGRAWLRSTRGDLIVMADGAQVMVNRNDPKNPSMMLVYGEIWAEITPRPEKEHLRFESPEGEGAVEVLGTRLHLEYR
jgi:hypothetical protein